MDSSFTAKHISSQWATLCKSAQSSAKQLAEECHEAAAALMNSEADRFCRLPAPTTRDQLNAAYTRRMALSARLTAIKRAEALARANPDVMEQILAETARFCDGELPGDGETFLALQKRNLELTARIADLCAAVAR